MRSPSGWQGGLRQLDQGERPRSWHMVTHPRPVYGPMQTQGSCVRGRGSADTNPAPVCGILQGRPWCVRGRLGRGYTPAPSLQGVRKLGPHEYGRRCTPVHSCREFARLHETRVGRVPGGALAVHAWPQFAGGPQTRPSCVRGARPAGTRVAETHGIPQTRGRRVP